MLRRCGLWYHGGHGERSGKHAEVSAESLDRRAGAHRKLASAHEQTSRHSREEDERLTHMACAMMHEETAGILAKEAEEIRGHR